MITIPIATIQYALKEISYDCSYYIYISVDDNVFPHLKTQL